MDNCCDLCDALLTTAESEANPRWQQELCDYCAAEYDAANPLTTTGAQNNDDRGKA